MRNKEGRKGGIRSLYAKRSKCIKSVLQFSQNAPNNINLRLTRQNQKQEIISFFIHDIEKSKEQSHAKVSSICCLFLSTGMLCSFQHYTDTPVRRRQCYQNQEKTNIRVSLSTLSVCLYLWNTVLLVPAVINKLGGGIRDVGLEGGGLERVRMKREGLIRLFFVLA